MNQLMKTIIDDLSKVATTQELRYMVQSTEDDEAIEYASTITGVPENELRRASFFNILGANTDDEVVALVEKYRNKFDVSMPEYLQTLLSQFNLDSPIVLDQIRDNGDYVHLARLQTLQFEIRGKSFVKDYRTFRSKENISGKSNYHVAKRGTKSTKTATNNVFMIKDKMIRYPEDVKTQDVVAYAPTEEFWGRKPADVVMSKIYSYGAIDKIITLDAIEELIDSMEAPYKEVADQIKWTLDGSYSKYGWFAKYNAETRSLEFELLGHPSWDGFDVPEGQLSYKEYKKNKKSSR